MPLRVGRFVGAVVLFVVLPSVVAAERPSQAVGTGSWSSQRDTVGKRDWHVQVKRLDDGAINGELVVIGSPTLHRTRLEGRVDGTDVYGVLVNERNQQVGTFTGAVFKGGVSGTYTTTDGDSGAWSWEGPAGARALKEDVTALP